MATIERPAVEIVEGETPAVAGAGDVNEVAGGVPSPKAAGPVGPPATPSTVETLENATNPGKRNVSPFWTTAFKNPAATEVSNCLLWRLNPANPGIKTRQLDMSDTQTPDLATHGSRLLIASTVSNVLKHKQKPLRLAQGRQ